MLGLSTALTGVLGGTLKPFNSVLSNIISPSLITQGSSLCGLLLGFYYLTIRGRISCF